MPYLRVVSSQLHGIDYSPETKILKAQYNCFACKSSGEKDGEPCPKCKKTGHTGDYHYAEVPPEKWERLNAAHEAGESVGSLFNEIIKKPQVDGQPEHPFVFMGHGKV